MKALEIASDIEATPEILRVLVGIAPLLVRQGKEKGAIQLLRFVTAQPEIKSSDQERAKNLLNDLISEHALHDEVAEIEPVQDMSISEIVERYIGS